MRAKAMVALATGVLGAGCVHSESESHDDTLDPIPLLIQTDLDAPPLFAAIRAEDDPWQQIPFDGTGRFEIELGGAYELFYVCEDGGRTWTQVIFSMTADAYSRTIGCTPIQGPTPTVTVTGQMLQPGRVEMGDSRSSTTAPWTYSMELPRATYDLVAHDGDRVVVRRSVVIDAPATMEPIDLGTGVLFEKTKMRFTGVLGDETVTTRTLWLTENGISVLAFEGDTARELPDEILTPNDATVAVASADSLYTHRETPLFSLPDVFFPPRLEGVELTDSTARWDVLPAGADAWFTVTAGEVAVLAVATGRWLIGRHSMHTDFAIEGYRDEWRVPATSARRRELYFELGGGTTTSYGYDVLAGGQ
ncbi:MAG: hypothetical protein AB7L94_34155 [Kofleriaceae bacterium]